VKTKEKASFYLDMEEDLIRRKQEQSALAGARKSGLRIYERYFAANIAIKTQKPIISETAQAQITMASKKLEDGEKEIFLGWKPTDKKGENENEETRSAGQDREEDIDPVRARESAHVYKIVQPRPFETYKWIR